MKIITRTSTPSGFVRMTKSFIREQKWTRSWIEVHESQEKTHNYHTIHERRAQNQHDAGTMVE